MWLNPANGEPFQMAPRLVGIVPAGLFPQAADTSTPEEPRTLEAGAWMWLQDLSGVSPAYLEQILPISPGIFTTNTTLWVGRAMDWEAAAVAAEQEAPAEEAGTTEGAAVESMEIVVGTCDEAVKIVQLPRKNLIVGNCPVRSMFDPNTPQRKNMFEVSVRGDILTVSRQKEGADGSFVGWSQELVLTAWVDHGADSGDGFVVSELPAGSVVDIAEIATNTQKGCVRGRLASGGWLTMMPSYRSNGNHSITMAPYKAQGSGIRKTSALNMAITALQVPQALASNLPCVAIDAALGDVALASIAKWVVGKGSDSDKIVCAEMSTAEEQPQQTRDESGMLDKLPEVSATTQGASSGAASAQSGLSWKELGVMPHPELVGQVLKAEAGVCARRTRLALAKILQLWPEERPLGLDGLGGWATLQKLVRLMVSQADSFDAELKALHGSLMKELAAGTKAASELNLLLQEEAVWHILGSLGSEEGEGGGSGGASKTEESEHPYPCNANRDWTISIPGAKRIKFVWDEQTDFEASYDFLQFFVNGTEVGPLNSTTDHQGLP